MFEFGWPWLGLLLLLPPCLRLLKRRNSKRAAAIRFPGIRQRLPAQGHIAVPGWRRDLLSYLLWSLVVLATMQPRWVGEPIPLQEEAREMMIALDLSMSMTMEDMTLNGEIVSRLKAAHKILADFIRRRHGDRIGLIVYADSAHVYVPVTSDLESVARLAEEAEIGLAGQRTALGDAIALSIRYFQDRDTKDPVVLMLTDGMINTGSINAEEALILAQGHDVRIHTIGIGSDEMIIPGIFGNRRINPSADLDEVFLTRIAQASGGEYFRARNVDEMNRIYDIIDQIEPVLGDEEFFRPRTSLSHWPLLAAFILSILMLVRALWQRLPSRREVPV
ncbi:MAG: VWA domain-containing protein [Idiomarina sp.]|nr:VWA domain-containing protein [Idiomarina sp.]